MGVKLTEMNAVLSELFEKVQNDTLVMIIGDHGMDRKGDHGGDSFEEMNAGLFFYSKSPLFKADRISIARKIVEEMTKYENYEDFSVFNGARTVPQIDIVSTVCYLLGVDVPFGNLGMGVTELLSWDDKAMIDTIRDNAYQVSRYLAVYGETRSDIKSSFTEISNLLVEAEAAYNLMDDNLDTESAIKIYVLYARYLRQVLLKARKIWSQFEYVLISMGILICIANCVAVSLFLIFGRYYSLLAVISGGLLSFLGLVRPVSLIMYPKTVDNSMLTLTTRHEVAFFFALGYLICTIYLNRGDINLKSLQQNSMIINITATIVYTIIPGSDSFLIFEDYVLFHFLQFYHLIELFYRSKAKSKLYFVETLILMIILRFNFAITVCRPDQGPVCRVTFYSDPQSSVSPWWGPILSYILGLLCWFYISHCKVYEIKNGWFLASIFSSLGYWTVSTWEAQAYISSGLSSVLNPIFLAVYSLCSFRLLSSTKKESLTVSIYAILLLFQKPMGQVSLHLLMLYVLMRKFQIKRNSKEFDVDIWLYLGLAGFFSTGHQNQLASVQYDTGFIGLQKASMVLSPIYIWLNTVSAPLLFSTIPISDIQFNNRLAALILSTTSVTAFTGHFARHSQAFRVWGPKFLFYLSNSAAIFLGMMIEAAVPSKIITKKHKDS